MCVIFCMYSDEHPCIARQARTVPVLDSTCATNLISLLIIIIIIIIIEVAACCLMPEYTRDWISFQLLYLQRWHHMAPSGFKGLCCSLRVSRCCISVLLYIILNKLNAVI